MPSTTTPPTTTIDSLIVVCCHAIWLGDATQANSSESAEEEWLVEPFQTGETPTFVAHIKAGVEALKENPNAILVFSGGPTKPDRSDRSEADSYHLYAEKRGLISSAHQVRQRVFVDEYATDSFQNVLLSLLQFPIFAHMYRRNSAPSRIEDSGHEKSPTAIQRDFPLHLTIVSHDFKRARFEELHLPAIKYPTNPARFKYIGIDPPFDEQKIKEIREGDLKRGYGIWQTDLFGQGSILAQKRVVRGWTKERRAQFQEMMWMDCARFHVNSSLDIVLFAVGSDNQQHFPRSVCWK